MMREYVLSCESTVDLPKEHLERRQIAYISYPFAIDGIQYRDDLGETISHEAFYALMENGAEVKTAQINACEFEEYFEPFLKEGKDILHLCLSSGITGVLNSAKIAQMSLLEKYPDRKIYLVDSLAASSGFGLLVDRLADLRDGGMGLAELYQWAEDNKLRVHHWFFSEDLKYYIKGGRISKTAGLVGGILGICPLMNVSADGKLVPRAKIRSKNKAVHAIVDKMALLAEDRTGYAGRCCISHSACPDTARKVADLVKKRFPKLQGDVEIYNIGTTIGGHSGPGTVALFFWGDKRQD